MQKTEAIQAETKSAISERELLIVKERLEKLDVMAVLAKKKEELKANYFIKKNNTNFILWQ